MAALILLLFLAALAVVVGSAVVVLTGAAGHVARYAYIAVAIVVFGVSYWATSYDYYQNANTHIYGWPIPAIVWQRENATSPWADFPFYGAFPLNLILFMSVPSLAFLAIAYLHRSGWRLGLRTLLIATTLVAVVLGLIMAVV